MGAGVSTFFINRCKDSVIAFPILLLFLPLVSGCDFRLDVISKEIGIISRQSESELSSELKVSTVVTAEFIPPSYSVDGTSSGVGFYLKGELYENQSIIIYGHGDCSDPLGVFPISSFEQNNLWKYIRLSTSDIETTGAALSIRVQDNDGRLISDCSPLVFRPFAIHDKFIRITDIVANESGYVAYREDGSIISWPGEYSSMDLWTKSLNVFGYVANIKQLVTIERAFAAITSDNKVISWGEGPMIPDSLVTELVNIERLVPVEGDGSSGGGFIAINGEGAATAWGDSHLRPNPVDSVFVRSLDNTLSVTNNRNQWIENTFVGLSWAALKEDGTVTTWGSLVSGGDSSAVASELHNVVQIVATYGAFAALRSDGSVVTWGHPSYGGDSSSVSASLTSVSSVVASDGAFAALRSDGTVVTWGNTSFGGNSTSVQASLNSVSKVVANSKAFAALRSSGGVVTWGSPLTGGNGRATRGALLTSGVVELIANRNSMVALKSDGAVVSWGEASSGGQIDPTLASEIHSISTLVSRPTGYIGKRTDGKVIGWGQISDPHLFSHFVSSRASEFSNVQKIVGTSSSVSVLNGDGTVVFSSLYLNPTTHIALDVSKLRRMRVSTTLANSGSAYASILDDGSVYAWGKKECGADTSSAQAQLHDVIEIYAANCAFAALTATGEVVAWGSPGSGGDVQAVSSQLVGIKKVVAGKSAFAALRGDQTVVTWGSATMGGDSTDVVSQLVQIKDVWSNGDSFVALNDSGGLVLWGSPTQGGSPMNASGSLTDIKLVVPGIDSYLALRSNNTIAIWGADKALISSKNLNSILDVAEIFTSKSAGPNSYSTISGTIGANGNLYTWGSSFGGPADLPNANLVNVKKIAVNALATAAINGNGKIVVWGSIGDGGWISAKNEKDLIDLVDVCGTAEAFLALRSDGKVVAWGDSYYAGELPQKIRKNRRKVVSISCQYSNMAVVFEDGKAESWGSYTLGNFQAPISFDQARALKSIKTFDYGYIGERVDGSVVLFGHSYDPSFQILLPPLSPSYR
jgi:alpha-tubulin suppressor-like RCC1 family protein